jgi:hypothetical protein
LARVYVKTLLLVPLLTCELPTAWCAGHPVKAHSVGQTCSVIHPLWAAPCNSWHGARWATRWAQRKMVSLWSVPPHLPNTSLHQVSQGQDKGRLPGPGKKSSRALSAGCPNVFYSPRWRPDAASPGRRGRHPGSHPRHLCRNGPAYQLVSTQILGAGTGVGSRGQAEEPH